MSLDRPWLPDDPKGADLCRKAQAASAAAAEAHKQYRKHMDAVAAREARRIMAASDELSGRDRTVFLSYVETRRRRAVDSGWNTNVATVAESVARELAGVCEMLGLNLADLFAAPRAAANRRAGGMRTETIISDGSGNDLATTPAEIVQLRYQLAGAIQTLDKIAKSGTKYGDEWCVRVARDMISQIPEELGGGRKRPAPPA
jgi:hypothetical protein